MYAVDLYYDYGHGAVADLSHENFKSSHEVVTQSTFKSFWCQVKSQTQTQVTLVYFNWFLVWETICNGLSPVNSDIIFQLRVYLALVSSSNSVHCFHSSNIITSQKLSVQQKSYNCFMQTCNPCMHTSTDELLGVRPKTIQSELVIIENICIALLPARFSSMNVGSYSLGE